MSDENYPLDVEYCGLCGLPPEYCEYGSEPDKCKEWLKENIPDLYEELVQQVEGNFNTIIFSRNVFFFFFIAQHRHFIMSRLIYQIYVVKRYLRNFGPVISYIRIKAERKKGFIKKGDAAFIQIWLPCLLCIQCI